MVCAPSDCTREEALDAFDLLVRRTMPCRIRASTGRTLLQYESFMTMIFPIMLSVFDVACAHLVAGDSARQLIGATIEVGTRTLAGLPLSFALSMWMCGLCQNLQGMRGFDKQKIALARDRCAWKAHARASFMSL